MSTGANFRINYWKGTNVENELAVKPEDEAETVETDVVSAFVPEKKRNIVYGSSFSNIEASAGKLDYDSEQIFDLRDSQADAIGDIYFNLKLAGRFEGGEGNTITHLLSEFAFIKLVKKIEFYIGGSIWQTIEDTDLVSFNITHLTPGSFNHFNLASRGGLSESQALDKISFIYTNAQDENLNAIDHIFNIWIPLPFFSSGGVENSLLLAAIVDKSVTMKVKYASKDYESVLIDSDRLSQIRFVSSSVLVKNYMMTNFEKINIVENTIAKRVKITQTITVPWGYSNPPTLLKTIPIDAFDLLCSHLIITLEEEFYYAGFWRIEYADLRVDGESFCGKIDGDFLLMYGAQSIGLMNNTILPISGSYSDGEQKFFHVFPISSRAYGLDGIPFDKVNNIELVIKVNYLDVPTIHAIGSSNPYKVNVTAVGSKLCVYSNGEARLY